MKPSTEIKYPRELAVRILTRVLSDGRPLDEVLAEHAQGLGPSQRGWLQEICAGSLRWKGRIDLVLDSLATRKKPTGWLRKVLMTAAYQLMAQDRTSVAHVVSETVSLIKAKEGSAPSQFGNAILRRVAEQREQWRNLEFSPEFPKKEAARWASLPDWFWERLLQTYGQSWTIDFAKACLERPKLWIRVREGWQPPSWAKAGPVPGSFEVEELPEGPLDQWPGFAEGKFFVQDISSQILVHEVSAELKKGEQRSTSPASLSDLRCLDLCAAPGGKSVGLAWSGFKTLASDQGEARLRLLQQTVARAAPGQVEILEPSQAAALSELDLVWVDAPCSGTGIIRRHPDVRWLKRPSDIASLNALQSKLIQSAWKQLKPGGYLVYSVCSVLPEEGEQRVAAQKLLASRTVKTWNLAPHSGARGDGFWAILLQKE